MSTAAVAWALDGRRTGKLNPACRLVLVALADYANPEGRNAFPAVPTLASRLHLSDRQIQRHVRQLEELELIRPGDRRLVDHIPAYARPNVWDLALNPYGARAPSVDPVTSMTPGDTHDGPGCHTGHNRGDMGVTQTKNRTTNENSPQTPLELEDDDPAVQLSIERAAANRVPVSTPRSGSCADCGQDKLLVAEGVCRRCLVIRMGDRGEV